jgi:hypothetical protein
MYIALKFVIPTHVRRKLGEKMSSDDPQNLGPKSTCRVTPPKNGQPSCQVFADHPKIYEVAHDMSDVTVTITKKWSTVMSGFHGSPQNLRGCARHVRSDRDTFRGTHQKFGTTQVDTQPMPKL